MEPHIDCILWGHVFLYTIRTESLRTNRKEHFEPLDIMHVATHARRKTTLQIFQGVSFEAFFILENKIALFGIWNAGCGIRDYGSRKTRIRKTMDV